MVALWYFFSFFLSDFCFNNTIARKTSIAFHLLFFHTQKYLPAFGTKPAVLFIEEP